MIPKDQATAFKAAECDSTITLNSWNQFIPMEIALNSECAHETEVSPLDFHHQQAILTVSMSKGKKPAETTMETTTVAYCDAPSNVV